MTTKIMHGTGIVVPTPKQGQTPVFAPTTNCNRMFFGYRGNAYTENGKTILTVRRDYAGNVVFAALERTIDLLQSCVGFGLEAVDDNGIITLQRTDVQWGSNVFVKKPIIAKQAFRALALGTKPDKLREDVRVALQALNNSAIIRQSTRIETTECSPTNFKPISEMVVADHCQGSTMIVAEGVMSLGMALKMIVPDSRNSAKQKSYAWISAAADLLREACRGSDAWKQYPVIEAAGSLFVIPQKGDLIMDPKTLTVARAQGPVGLQMRDGVMTLVDEHKVFTREGVQAVKGTCRSHAYGL